MIHRLVRNFSNFISKGNRDTFTPKITKNLNKTFEESFPSPPAETAVDLSLKSGAIINTSPTANGNKNYNYIQPGRTYREELYASRRFELNPSQNSNYAFRRLQGFLQDEKIPAKVKEKRHFVRAGLVEHAMIYAGRRKKFNSLVRETIRKVVNIHESQK